MKNSLNALAKILLSVGLISSSTSAELLASPVTRKPVPQRFNVERSKTPFKIANVPQYPTQCWLLSAIKMPNAPGGTTYNERYLTYDSPERVLIFFRNALASGSWQVEQSGWSVNATDSQKNFVRVHVISQDLSTRAPSTRFMIEYKEAGHDKEPSLTAWKGFSGS